MLQQSDQSLSNKIRHRLRIFITTVRTKDKFERRPTCQNQPSANDL